MKNHTFHVFLIFLQNISNQFTKTASGERCAFIGNVVVGKDITVAELKKFYTAVTLVRLLNSETINYCPQINYTMLKIFINFIDFYGYFGLF